MTLTLSVKPFKPLLPELSIYYPVIFYSVEFLRLKNSGETLSCQASRPKSIPSRCTRLANIPRRNHGVEQHGALSLASWSLGWQSKLKIQLLLETDKKHENFCHLQSMLEGLRSRNSLIEAQSLNLLKRPVAELLTG